MNEQDEVIGKGKREERGMQRFPISARACFLWKGPDDNWYESNGMTQNISARGVFIVTRSSPPLGGTVEITVDIPSVNPNAIAKGQLRGKGVVTRITPDTGFAAEVSFNVLRVKSSKPY